MAAEWGTALWDIDRWPALTVEQLVATKPVSGRGHLIGVGDWKLVVEILLPADAEGIWGVAKWGEQDWNVEAWADLTPYVRGLAWTRGSDEKWGRPRIGEGTVTLDSTGDAWSPWSASPPQGAGAYFAPGTLIRVAVVSDTAPEADGWIPQICGVVATWGPTYIDPKADQFVDVTFFETLRDLATIDDNALPGLVGGGEYPIPRFERLLEAADWPYGFVADADNIIDFPGSYPMQSTDMAMNRVAECYVTADSCDIRFRTSRKGNALAEYNAYRYADKDPSVWPLMDWSHTGSGYLEPNLSFDWSAHHAWRSTKFARFVTDYAPEVALVLKGDIDNDGTGTFTTATTPTYLTADLAIGSAHELLDVRLAVDGGTSMDAAATEQSVALMLYIPDDYDGLDSIGLWSNGGGTRGQGFYLAGWDLVAGHNTASTYRDEARFTLPGPGLYSVGMSLGNLVGETIKVYVDGTEAASTTLVTAPADGTGDPYIGDHSVLFNPGDADPNSIAGSGLGIGLFAWSSAEESADWFADHHAAGPPSVPLRFVAYDSDSFHSGNSDDHIANDVRFARTGGTQQVFEQLASIARHKRRTYVRNDFVVNNDAVVQQNAQYYSIRRSLNTLTVDALTVHASDRTDIEYLALLAADIGCDSYVYPPGPDYDSSNPKILATIANMTHQVTPRGSESLTWAITFGFDTQTVYNLPAAQLPSTQP